MDRFVCVPCPDGAVCQGNLVLSAAALPGYWRLSPEDGDFVPCDNAAACAGGVDSACAPGYRGALCGACAPGYAGADGGLEQLSVPHLRPRRSGKACLRCPPEAQSVAVMIVLILLQLALLAAIFRVSLTQRPAMVAIARVMLNFLQSLAILRDLRLGWPRLLGYLLLGADKLSTPNLSSAEADCLLLPSLAAAGLHAGRAAAQPPCHARGRRPRPAAPAWCPVGAATHPRLHPA